MMRKILLMCMLVFLWTGAAFAQDKTITGKVADPSGSPIPGVNIMGKGTSSGTVTDANGNFSISVGNDVKTLVFSFIGFTSQEVDVTTASNLSVSLKEESTNLDEVIVTGLATSIKRSNAANAVTTISSNQLVGSTRAVSVDAALSGKIVGANIVQNSGAPGGGLSVQLRGISSITGSSQPLYVIDGVIMNNDQFDNGRSATAFNAAGGSSQSGTVNRISDINPADIENIEILKGSSAAAIYGGLSNAGVIIITTKKGQAGKTRINFGQDIGFVSAIHLLGYEGWTNEKIDLFYEGAKADKEKALLAAATASGKLYDYEKEIYGNVGLIRNTRASVSGGNEKTKFLVSAGLSNEDGIVKTTGFKRNSLKASIDQKVTKFWDVSFTSSFINSSNKRGFEGNDNNGVNVAYNLSYIPNYAELHPASNGLFPDSDYTGDNPLAVVERAINKEQTNRFIQSFGSNIYFWQKEKSTLKFAFNGGADYLLTEGQLFMPDDMQSQISASSGFPGATRLSKNRALNTNMTGFLVYNFELGKFNFTSSGGFTKFTVNQDLSFIQGEGLPHGTASPENATVRKIGQFNSEYKNVGFSVQQEANYNDMVIATAGIRFDKSTLNGNAKKYYPFLKGSLAVNIAKFPFWSIQQINLFKLRAAYGETGGLTSFGATYTPLVSSVLDGKLGLRPSLILGNKNIDPERATEFEYGSDISFFNNRIGLEATLYNKTVYGFISTKALAPSTGFSSISAFNVGNLQNKGLELALNITPIKAENFTWNFGTQYWFNKSKITKLDVPVSSVGSGFSNTFGLNYMKEGLSPTAWVGTPAVPQADGTSFFTIYGDAQPKFQMSFSNQMVVYKNFTFSFLFHWRGGGYNSNLTTYNKDAGGTTKDWSQLSADGKTPLGISRTQKITAAQFVQDASYVRLREVSLYYSLPKHFINSLFNNVVQGVKFGVSGNNMLTFTHNYQGYDPEVSNFGTQSVGAQMDLQSYPNTKRLFFHVNIDF